MDPTQPKKFYKQTTERLTQLLREGKITAQEKTDLIAEMVTSMTISTSAKEHIDKWGERINELSARTRGESMRISTIDIRQWLETQRTQVSRLYVSFIGLFMLAVSAAAYINITSKTDYSINVLGVFGTIAAIMRTWKEHIVNKIVSVVQGTSSSPNDLYNALSITRVEKWVLNTFGYRDLIDKLNPSKV